MFIKVATVKRKNAVYRYAQLVESYRRKDGMPTQRVLASLGRRSELEIANLRKALAASRDGTAVVLDDGDTGVAGAQVLDNLDWLDIAVVIAVLRRLGVDTVLADLLERDEAEVADADVVLSLVAQRCVDPDSKLAAVKWFGRTALPELLGIPMGRFNNTRIHRVLERLEAADEQLQQRLASAVNAHTGGFSLLFLDVTDTWFVGRGPSLAQSGRTKEGLVRRKVGIALLCDARGYPLRWSVVQGRRHDSGPMKEMVRALQSVPWARGVPLVLDRAMGATAHVEQLLASGREFVTALQRNEFDAYAPDLPCAVLSEVDWRADDAVSVAGNAVVAAGMERVSDTLYVKDLGVVQRKLVDDGLTAARFVPATDKCRQRLADAVAIRDDVDNGRIKSLSEAGRIRGFRPALTSKTLRLLRLAPDLQSRIAAGEAASLSIKALREMSHLPDFEAQRTAFDQALKRAAAAPDARRARGTGKVSAAPRLLPACKSPPRLHAVLAFNPELWRRQKARFDEQLAELRRWARNRNRAVRQGGRRGTEASARAAAHARLARSHLVDACEVHVTTDKRGGREVPQLQIRPIPEEWARRQRFLGWQIIVAQPGDRHSAAELVRIYRAKDGVEKDFQTIKSVLSLRPVRHRTDAKVRAHVTLCMLALLVERSLDQQLQGRMTGVAALDLLSDIHLNRMRTAGGSVPVYTITRARSDQAEVLQALKLEHLADSARMTAGLRGR